MGIHNGREIGKIQDLEGPMSWESMFDVLRALGDNEGVSEEQRLSVYETVKANLESVPDIVKHTDILVSKKQIKVSWKKGGQIAKFNRYENAHELTEFFIGEIARVWMSNRPGRDGSGNRKDRPSPSF
jgi:hypothetical protein